MRILISLQYLGTRYAGWQTQANAVGVQQVVESALSTMYQTPIRIEGAGRTDSGVHARAQRAHADVPFEIAPPGFLMGLNDLLSPAIRVAADGFLRYMVRGIAGSLIEIGRGKLEGGALQRSLEPTFEEARWTAPAKGLILWDIAY